MIINMREDKFDPKTQKDLLNQNQKSFMSDSVEEPPKEESSGLMEKCWACLTVSRYRQYFDVTQDQIKSRILRSLFPFTGQPLFENGKIDLYGPLWIFITLNIAMAIFGYMCMCFDNHYKQADIVSILQVHKIAKSYGFLMFYFLLIPLGLYFLLNFLMSQSPSYPKILAAYGYSFTIFIPITFLFLIPVETLRWFFLIVAGIISL